ARAFQSEARRNCHRKPAGLELRCTRTKNSLRWTYRLRTSLRFSYQRLCHDFDVSAIPRSPGQRLSFVAQAAHTKRGEYDWRARGEQVTDPWRVAKSCVMKSRGGAVEERLRFNEARPDRAGKSRPVPSRCFIPRLGPSPRPGLDRGIVLDEGQLAAP